jgi:hypothetical protein
LVLVAVFSLQFGSCSTRTAVHANSFSPVSDLVPAPDSFLPGPKDSREQRAQHRFLFLLWISFIPNGLLAAQVKFGFSHWLSSVFRFSNPSRAGAIRPHWFILAREQSTRDRVLVKHQLRRLEASFRRQECAECSRVLLCRQGPAIVFSSLHFRVGCRESGLRISHSAASHCNSFVCSVSAAP